MKLEPPDSLDSDELADWSRHPATLALAKALRERWKPDRWKQSQPENISRLQGQQEVVDAVEEWFSYARR